MPQKCGIKKPNGSKDHWSQGKEMFGLWLDPSPYRQASAGSKTG
ncbi:MAG: hypothetical protein O8C66_15980 [Candidatus Methanoperedens sp.]|nr:hypothetical protein [Candidatus Methanoperedens sp.]MCZ7371994.1 hypothetical protein [Candidatus Methanoperedens sp.]